MTLLKGGKLYNGGLWETCLSFDELNSNLITPGRLLPWKLLPHVFLLLLVVMATSGDSPCWTPDHYNMTMVQRLWKSDVVVYGKDVDHGKFRTPSYVDARFDVYCVLKVGRYSVPGQVIIENIIGGDGCSGVKGQTEEGKEYIIGLQRELSGFMSYANVNPLQKTAFPATQENLDKLAAMWGMDDWTEPKTGDQDLCPVPSKPRFCTKVKYPDDYLNVGVNVTGSVILMTLTLIVVVMQFTFIDILDALQASTRL